MAFGVQYATPEKIPPEVIRKAHAIADILEPVSVAFPDAMQNG